MKAGSAAKLIVDALLQRFLPLARRRIETAQAQVFFSTIFPISYFHVKFPLVYSVSFNHYFSIKYSHINWDREYCILYLCIT